MKTTTTETKKQIVTRYAKMIAAAWKTNDLTEVDRLTMERNRKLRGE
jgi:hypothetical protein